MPPTTQRASRFAKWTLGIFVLFLMKISKDLQQSCASRTTKSAGIQRSLVPVPVPKCNAACSEQVRLSVEEKTEKLVEAPIWKRSAVAVGARGKVVGSAHRNSSSATKELGRVPREKQWKLSARKYFFGDGHGEFCLYPQGKTRRTCTSIRHQLGSSKPFLCSLQMDADVPGRIAADELGLPNDY